MSILNEINTFKHQNEHFLEYDLYQFEMKNSFTFS